MEYIVKLMVCGHEIGHDCLHREQAKGASGLQEFTPVSYTHLDVYKRQPYARIAHIVKERVKLPPLCVLCSGRV